MPEKWMDSWRKHHAEFGYSRYDNDFLRGFKFRCNRQIEALLEKRAFAGVADLMRYEILYEFGGVIPDADSICIKSTAELFSGAGAYTVYENEFLRGRLVSPILAAQPADPFVGAIIERLSETDPETLGTPWIFTGNLLCAQMIEELSPDIRIFPSHYFNPYHYTGYLHPEAAEAYAVQLWGSTTAGYSEARRGTGLRGWRAARAEKAAARAGRKSLDRMERAYRRDNWKRLSNLFPDTIL